MTEPISETVAEATDQRCPNSKCGRLLDGESLFTRRCQHCKCVLPGNQIRRKYPKPPVADANVQQFMQERADIIATDRGGRETLTTLEQSAIDRLVETEAFLSSWVSYFHRAGPVTERGRARSGYQQYLATLDRWMRLAALVGLDRRSKQATLTPRQWLEELAEQQADDEHDETEGTSDAADDAE